MMMHKWNLLPFLSAPMPYQLALDEVLFLSFKAPASADADVLAPMIRFYISSEPWVSVGYFCHDYDHEHPNLIRRITGGGRVFHGHDLVMTLFAHKNHHMSFSDVRQSYAKIHQALNAGFQMAGLKTSLFQADQAQKIGTDCFTSPITSDISLASKKIAGGAQKRSMGFLMHQESIQLENLNQSLSLRNALLLGYQKIFDVQFQSSMINPEHLSEAKKLANNKYHPLNRLKDH